MANSRNKGAAAEREIAKLLFDELGMTFKRDTHDRPSNNCHEMKTYDLAKWVLAKIEAEA